MFCGVFELPYPGTEKRPKTHLNKKPAGGGGGSRLVGRWVWDLANVRVGPLVFYCRPLGTISLASLVIYAPQRASFVFLVFGDLAEKQQVRSRSRELSVEMAWHTWRYTLYYATPGRWPLVTELSIARGLI
jgi:hypothetical protein